MDAEKEKGLRKKVGKTAVALTAAASVVVGGAFDSASDILSGGDGDAQSVTTYVDHVLPDDGGDGGGDTDGQDGEKIRKRGAASAVQGWILRLPLAVRMLAVVPLWAAGQGILAACAALWGAASPFLSRAAGFALLLLLLFLGFAGAAKAVFPDLPLKRLLRPRSLLLVLLGGAALGAADLVIAYVRPDAVGLRRGVEAAGALLVLLLSALSFALRERKRRAREEEARTEEEERAAAEEPRYLTFDDGAGEFTLLAGQKQNT